MKDFLTRLVRDDDGQDLIEYGLLAGIITAFTVTAIQAIGPKVQDYIEDLDSMLPAARLIEFNQFRDQEGTSVTLVNSESSEKRTERVLARFVRLTDSRI